MDQQTPTPCCAVTRRLGPDAVARVDAALAVLGQPGAVKLAQIAAWPEVAAVGLSQPTLSKHRKHISAPSAAAKDVGESEPRKSPVYGGVPQPRDDDATAPGRFTTAELEERAVDLRVAGKKIRHIAAELGVDKETARDALDRALIRSTARTDRKAEHAREIELRRCEAIVAAFWEEATGEKGEGQARAADRVLRASERKAKLLGLDAATGNAQLPFYLAPGFDEFLGVMLAPLEGHPEELQLVLDAVRGHIAMLAAQKPAKPSLRLVHGGRSA